MVFASVVIRPRSKTGSVQTRFFYLGADTYTDLDRWLSEHDWWQYVLRQNQNQVRYVLLPWYLHSYLSGSGVEVVKVSEFDRRICSSGDGIPSVQLVLDLQ